MAKYKTKDGSDVVIPGVGVTTNGVIETEQKLESPILQKISESDAPTPPAAPPVVAPQPAQAPTTQPAPAPAETKEQQ